MHSFSVNISEVLEHKITTRLKIHLIQRFLFSEMTNKTSIRECMPSTVVHAYLFHLANLTKMSWFQGVFIKAFIYCNRTYFKIFIAQITY